MVETGSRKELPRIQRLSEEVVNRIAAGEIIQRPVSALKELLENSLDAGATQVNIAVKEGGNKLLQIQDNGHGIQVEDLPLLCERHATSKLSSFEDLGSISTLGFRGEALASISYVAHMTVTTMTAAAPHGYKVSYRDGLIDAGRPKACAAMQGTTITVEDLFYNMPTRKKALKNASDEFSRILDVVGCYAILKPEVGFTVKKQGEARADLHCLPGSARKDNIRNLFGAAVARNLLDFAVTENPPEGGEGLSCTVHGCMTGAEYSGKKMILIIFINGRPVECRQLKRAIELTYISLLPKTSKPFLFLDIRLPGGHVDVNLHPTKKEVGFLHAEELIKAICGAVEEKLTSSNTQVTRSIALKLFVRLIEDTGIYESPYARWCKQLASTGRRTFTQTLLPGAPTQDQGPESDADVRVSTRRDRAGGDHKLIRTDSRARTLDAFMRPPSDSQRNSPLSTAAAKPQAEAPGRSQAPTPALAAVRRRGAERGVIRVRQQWEAEENAKGLERSLGVSQRPNPSTASELASIQSLLADVEKHSHAGLLDLIRNHTFVGMADSSLALVQHGTRLHLADLTLVTREMFFQQVLARFEHLKEIEIEGRPAIRGLALLALEMEAAAHPEEEEEEDASRQEVADLIEELLLDKAEMLHEYVGLRISKQAELCSLPRLIDGYHPDTDYLPALVLALARDVDWSSERECFKGLAQALSELYCWKAPLFPEASGGASRAEPAGEPNEQPAEGASHLQNQTDVQREWTVQHVLFPALRMFWKPQKERAQDGSMLELTRLEHLYRIFERC